MKKITLLLAYLTVASAFPRQDRIVGGTITSIQTYPFSAVLLFSRNNISFRQNCGGSVINNRSMLTAAHCLNGNINLNNFRVRVGSTNASSGGSVHNSALRILHPQYNQGTLNNDIALLRVSTAFQLGTTVRPAAIIGQNVVIPDNTLIWATGWGWTTPSGNNPSEQLRHVQVRVVPQQRCQRAYTGFPITAAMICAGWDQPGRGSCQGDSGSPIVHNNVVIGATSFGQRCADPNFPTVYARVAHFTNWIRSNA
ncbi:jg7096 [Pararge aegeria aegeria]|uniref:Jg7096 protein n=1 Tax=Pararge aegeria aegeria TaxID=348720 RepID=A0A8S4R2N0_9NEOP|nr:jg7096 [Pararge aegeria aegeria]